MGHRRGSRALDAEIGARIREIREALGLQQDEMRALLERHGLHVSKTAYSRYETGGARATYEDIAVFACVDPRKRGRLWLAWGDAPASRSAGAYEDERCREKVIPAPAVARRRVR